MRHLFLPMLCLFQLAISAQTPLVMDFNPGPLETLDSLPVTGNIHWWAKTDGQYYTRYVTSSDNYFTRKRDSLARVQWELPDLPATLSNSLLAMYNGADQACVAMTVADLTGGNNLFYRTVKCYRTQGSWVAAQEVFNKTYAVNTSPGQPFQVPYPLGPSRVGDSTFYLPIMRVGQQGAPTITDYLYSANNGLTWGLGNALADWQAGPYYLDARDGHFWASGNAAFTGVAMWPYPDTAVKAQQVRGAYWRNDTLHVYVDDGRHWRRAADSWVVDTLPWCDVYQIVERQGRVYGLFADGVYVLREPQQQWERVWAEYNDGQSLFRGDLWAIDSADLVYLSTAHGLIHSTDGGAHWYKFHQALPQRGADYLYFYGNGLLSDHGQRLQRSPDGRQWMPFTDEQVVCAEGQRFLPLDAGGGLVLSAYREPAFDNHWRVNLLLSPDGLTWQPAGDLPDYLNVPWPHVQDGRLWLLEYNSIRYSDDLGEQWSDLALPADIVPEVYSGIISQGDTIMFSSYDAALFRSTDGGQNWTELNALLPPGGTTFIQLFRQGNKILYCGNGGRVWTSEDWGDSWTKTCLGLPGFDLAQAVLYDYQDSVLIAAGQYLSPDDGVHWLRLTGPVLPSSAKSIIWNDTALYFSHYSYGNYRALVNLPAQLALLTQTSSATASPSLSAVHIRPNPVRDWLQLSGLTLLPADWSIINLTGVVVAQGRLTEPRIDVSGLPEGMYWLRLQNGEQVVGIKFLRLRP